MGKQCISFDNVVMIWWATVWCVMLGSWPAVASAAPLEHRQQEFSSNRIVQQQEEQQELPGNPSSQGLIIGLSAGVAVMVLTGITLVICFPPRKWTRGRSTRPVKPWITQTTTTTVTSSRSGSHSRSFDDTDSLTDRAAPLPMTRFTNIDRRGRRMTTGSSSNSNDEEDFNTSAAATAANAASDIAGPSSRRPPARLHRYSVHVTSTGNSEMSSRGGEPLSPLLEEMMGGAPQLVTYETIKSDLAYRRGRPPLQLIQVPSPPSPASVKGKGKARMYYN